MVDRADASMDRFGRVYDGASEGKREALMPQADAQYGTAGVTQHFAANAEILEPPGSPRTG